MTKSLHNRRITWNFNYIPFNMERKNLNFSWTIPLNLQNDQPTLETWPERMTPPYMYILLSWVTTECPYLSLGDLDPSTSTSDQTPLFKLNFLKNY